VIGGLIAVLLIVTLGGRAIDGLRRAEAESILARLPQAEAVAYYDVLRRRMRRIVLMRALALISLLWMFVVFRQRLIKHEAPRMACAVAADQRAS
jgi:hypothetical protein